MTKRITTLACALIALTGSARAADIVETAVGAEDFKTLVAAVKAAGLVETLQGEGPFTVFAPTDEAFAKLPKGTVETLLKPENKAKLTAILTYHVVPGRVLAKDVVSLKSAKTVQGDAVRINASDAGVTLNASKVVKTDILCDNGVIHVIDAVLLPPEKPMKAAAARRMLESTVEEGVRLYNAGHHAECASTYATAMNTLADRGVDGVCSSSQQMMTTLVRRAEAERHPTRRAWMLRRGIDAMHVQLSATH